MGVRVLLVDDDKIQALTRKAILERSGFSAALASQGAEALEYLESQEGASVRMVITDHLMPHMSGPEFVSSLRGLGYQLPVLVLSGLAEAEAEYDALGVDFRMKPFPPEQLIALVTHLINITERQSA